MWPVCGVWTRESKEPRQKQLPGNDTRSRKALTAMQATASMLPTRRLSSTPVGLGATCRRNQCRVQANNEFRLSRMTSNKQSVSVNQSVSTSYEPSTSAPAGPSLVGAVAVGGLVLIALLKSRRALGELFDKLPWSKRSRDMDVVKGLNAIPNEGLHDDIIKAARARRSKERANHKLNLEEVELPENHPWATKHKVAKEEEKTIRARLSLRRSVAPPQPPMPEGGARAPRAPASGNADPTKQPRPRQQPSPQ